MLFYRFGLWVYQFLIRIAAVFTPKARQFIAGRKGLFSRLEAALEGRRDRRLIWVHCASLGEFEQGRPLIEQLRKSDPEYFILLTFFSPSGYEIRKNYDQADAVFYLPTDSPQHAARFVRLVSPSIAIFIKYEFWFYFLRELEKQQVPTISVSAIFRPSQLFFRWYGGLGRAALHRFTHFFVQNEASARLLQKIGIRKVSISGDTRLDRVAQLREQQPDFPRIEEFIGQHKVFILGSAWLSDVEVLAPALRWLVRDADWKILIAPHEIDEETLKSLSKALAPLDVSRYTRYQTEAQAPEVLLIDTMGMLSMLYAYGDLSYVGGAFGKGLHNTMEAAAHGLPVLFGNRKYKKFQEAKDLLSCGAAYALPGDENEALELVRRLAKQPEERDLMGKAAEQYVLKNRGATRQVMNFITSLLAK